MATQRDYREPGRPARYVGIVGMSFQAAVITALVPSAFNRSVAHGLLVLAMAAAVWALLLRFARMRTVVREDGILVASVLMTRFVPWRNAVSVGFGPSRFGGNCGQLSLVDGSSLELAGVRAEAEVREIATAMSGGTMAKVPLRSGSAAASRPTRAVLGVGVGLIVVATAAILVDGDRASVYVGLVAAYTLYAARARRDQ